MKNIIGIRREDLDKKGEQRVAIVPETVQDLAEKGFKFMVQPGIHPETQEKKRAFEDSEYEESGAKITEKLKACNIIFGLKEIKKEQLLPNKTYLFFSHTHKGQIKNRPLLQSMVDNNITLIDYELIKHKEGQRILTSFTYFAGYAGMIDSLWSFGQKLKTEGIEHQFSKIPQSIEKGNLQELRDLIHHVGIDIRENGTPQNLPPFICCFLGNGKTSHGAQEIFDILPVKEIKLSEVAEVFQSDNRNHVYKLVLRISDMFRIKKDSKYFGETFTASERSALYLKEPLEFESNLDTAYPYISMLMNCIIWGPEFPRLLSRDDAEKLYEDHKLLKVIGDITCDPEGSIQFSKETWIDEPVFTYNPSSRIEKFGFDGEGITVMAVTNLPCEFPADASDRFSKELAPYLPAILLANYDASSPNDAGLPQEIVDATILWKGEFTQDYKYMSDFITN
ncbi:MAG: hypothetical protein MRZ79_14340 [Bacteroidia bacterium]|nr:hypothetical protein [Bacteroidia bacterium]